MVKAILGLRHRLVSAMSEVKQRLRENESISPHAMEEMLAATEDIALAYEEMVDLTTFSVSQARSLDRLLESALRLTARAQQADWNHFKRSQSAHCS